MIFSTTVLLPMRWVTCSNRWPTYRIQQKNWDRDMKVPAVFSLECILKALRCHFFKSATFTRTHNSRQHRGMTACQYLPNTQSPQTALSPFLQKVNTNVLSIAARRHLVLWHKCQRLQKILPKTISARHIKTNNINGN